MLRCWENVFPRKEHTRSLSNGKHWKDKSYNISLQHQLMKKLGMNMKAVRWLFCVLETKFWFNWNSSKYSWMINNLSTPALFLILESFTKDWDISKSSPLPMELLAVKCYYIARNQFLYQSSYSLETCVPVNNLILKLM